MSRDFGGRSVLTFIPDTTILKKCVESDILIARYGAPLGRDPADEPVAKLLKRLAAQREPAPKAKRVRART